MAAVILHLIFAQLTLVLALVFHGVTKVSRWRPVWLAVPAAAGLIWTLAIGPAAAAAGFTAGPGRVASYLGGIAGHSSRIMHLGMAYSGMEHWLLRQLPIALIAGAAEAALAAWLEWLHTDEWDVQPPRPGLLLAVKRAAVTRMVRAGGVVTRDGACLGVDETSGGRAALSWRDMAGGVLVVGSPRSGTTTSSFQLVHAAIRLRKPVIAVNLDGGTDLATPLAAACAATRAPFYEFSAAGPASYEPFRFGDPARRAALVTAMINWSGTADHHRRSFAAYVNDMFELIDAAPADPRVPVLDDVAHLLDLGALQARLERVPTYHPHRPALAERIRVSVSLAQSDPEILATAAGQLAQLKASPIGQWLRPAGTAQRGHIDIGRVVRERGVALFSLGAPGHASAAARLAWLIGQDVLAADADLCDIGIGGDGLAWFDRCEGLPQPMVRDLIARGSDAGLPVVLTTTSPRVGHGLAGEVNALVIHRMPDTESAGSFAGLTGQRLVPEPYGRPLRSAPPVPAPDPGGPEKAGPSRGGMMGGLRKGWAGKGGFGKPAGGRPGPAPAPGLPPMISKPAVPPGALQQLGLGEFTLVVTHPKRLVALGRTVHARVPDPARPDTPGPARRDRPGPAPPERSGASVTPATFGAAGPATAGPATAGPAAATEAT